MKNHRNIGLFSCLLLISIFAKANSVDSLKAKCYQIERANTGLAVTYISQNQLDSLDLLYQRLPISCSEYGWNELIRLFLLCTKYSEKIDSISETQMDFIITYVNCVKHQKFVYGKSENHNFHFERMPTFLNLHDSVQVYLKELYNTLPVDTKQAQLVGTLIGKHNLFFESFNRNNGEVYPNGKVTYQSFEAQNKAIRKDVFFFLSLSTSMVINEQLGNSIQFDYLGVELKINQTLIGYSYGFGFNTTDPNYISIYNGKQLKPNTKANWAAHFWYNRLIFKESFVNPYIGAGFGFQQRIGSQNIGNNDVRLTISTVSVYPEIGLLFGNWPNYVVKLHGSYRLSGYWGAYFGDRLEGELNFVDNLNLNDWRIGLTFLIDINRERRQKAKIVGLR